MKPKDITPKDFQIIPYKDRILVVDSESDPSIGVGAQVGGLGGPTVEEVNDTIDKVDATINDSNQVITDLINARIDTSAKTILSDFSFGVSGALQIGTYSAGVSGDIRISPNGIIGRNSSGDNTFTLDGTTGAATFAGELTAPTGTLGALTIASGGNIKLGQTAYNMGTGFWIGDDGGTTKFSLGNPSGDWMTWDGTNLSTNKFSSVDTTVSFSDSVVSANLRNSNDTERTFSTTTYSKVKEIRLDGKLEAMTIKFDGRAVGGTTLGNAQIYIDGTPVGTVQALGAVYATFSENFAGSYPIGTLIQIYAKIDPGTGNGNLRNFRLYYDKEFATPGYTFSSTILVIADTTNQDP